MGEESKPFTVTDRRKFTADGRPRAVEAESPGEAEAAPSEPRAESRRPSPRERGGEPAADFAGFLVSLAAQASHLLTADEGSPLDNLAGARHMISILEMLQDKTEGRRDAEEDRLLERLLYELRLAYVERSKTVTA